MKPRTGNGPRPFGKGRLAARHRNVLAWLKGSLAVLALITVGCAGDPQAPVEAGDRAPEQPATLALFSENDRWGYRDSRGQIAIPARFFIAEPFSERGVAVVIDAEGWAYIDDAGKVLVRPFVFDNGPDPFSEGLARFVAGGKIGFFDHAGKVVIPARYDFAMPFENGRARICRGCREVEEGEHSRVVGGVWSEIDKTGQER